jgi:hypothetical protein
MLRDIQIEIRKLKLKGTDIGKCLTDGINKSFYLEEKFTDRYMLIAPHNFLVSNLQLIAHLNQFSWQI